MEFNSQICTNEEQSKRLLALGLKKETADMVILEHPRKEGRYFYIAKEDANWDGFPAWSLDRLIEILDIWYLDLNFHNFANAYEQVISYFEERVKGGFINKEYLEEL